MNRLLRPLSLASVLVGVSGLLASCQDEANKPEAKVAEEAVGIPNQGSEKTSEVTRDVTVIKETTVEDSKTGTVLSKKKEVTPVQIKKETDISTDVKVRVGETR